MRNAVEGFHLREGFYPRDRPTEIAGPVDENTCGRQSSAAS